MKNYSEDITFETHEEANSSLKNFEKFFSAKAKHAREY